MRILTFIEVDIRRRVISLRISYSVTLANFQGKKILNSNISETVRARVKIRARTFIEVGIRHRQTSLRMLYAVTLANIFKVKHLKC